MWVVALVDVRESRSHVCQAGMLHPIFQFVFKSAVFLINIQVIPLKIIVGNVYVRIAIVVYISYGDTQTQADLASMDAGLPGHFYEMAVVIPVKMISSFG